MRTLDLCVAARAPEGEASFPRWGGCMVGWWQMRDTLPLPGAGQARLDCTLGRDHGRDSVTVLHLTYLDSTLATYVQRLALRARPTRTGRSALSCWHSGVLPPMPFYANGEAAAPTQQQQQQVQILS